ncbi:MAG: alkaline phosphatase, partial [Bacteroidota bacterium]
ADPQKRLMLLLDFKNHTQEILDWLIETIAPYDSIFDPQVNPAAVQLAISGARPPAQDWLKLPNNIFIDGRLHDLIDASNRHKVALISAPFYKYSSWKGLDDIHPQELEKIQAAIQQAQELDLKLRFWATPDTPKAWHHFLLWQLDFINTDQVGQAGQFLQDYSKNFYLNLSPYPAYRARPNFSKRSPENIILFLAPGINWSHLEALKAINREFIALDNFKDRAMVQIESQDHFMPDAAAAASQIAGGEVVKNRYIGLNDQGQPIKNLLEIGQEKGLKIGLISSGLLSQASLSPFYAHCEDKSNYKIILEQLADNRFDLLAGEGNHLLDTYPGFKEKLMGQSYKFSHNLETFRENVKFPEILLSEVEYFASNPYPSQQNRFAELLSASIKKLHYSGNPFFLIAESARLDEGKTSTHMHHLMEELLSLDRAVSTALAYADRSQNTIVLFLCPYESGGLQLLDADPKKSWVLGSFSQKGVNKRVSGLFAYGPGARQCRGWLQGEQIFELIKDYIH